MFTNLRWADDAHTGILATNAAGDDVFIPADPANQDYDLLIHGRAASTLPYLPAVAPAVIADPD